MRVLSTTSVEVSFWPSFPGRCTSSTTLQSPSNGTSAEKVGEKAGRENMKWPWNERRAPPMAAQVKWCCIGKRELKVRGRSLEPATWQAASRSNGTSAEKVGEKAGRENMIGHGTSEGPHPWLLK
jgi:hypothetical protein